MDEIVHYICSEIESSTEVERVNESRLILEQYRWLVVGITRAE